jgi:hypothetical protein
MRCSCGASYSQVDWMQLPLEHAIGRDTVQRYVSTAIAWDIEVRRCVCGLLMSSFSEHGATSARAPSR